MSIFKYWYVGYLSTTSTLPRQTPATLPANPHSPLILVLVLVHNAVHHHARTKDILRRRLFLRPLRPRTRSNPNPTRLRPKHHLLVPLDSLSNLPFPRHPSRSPRPRPLLRPLPPPIQLVSRHHVSRDNRHVRSTPNLQNPLHRRIHVRRIRHRIGSQVP